MQIELTQQEQDVIKGIVNKFNIQSEIITPVIDIGTENRNKFLYSLYKLEYGFNTITRRRLEKLNIQEEELREKYEGILYFWARLIAPNHPYKLSYQEFLKTL
jgi:hypothetical protein